MAAYKVNPAATSYTSADKYMGKTGITADGALISSSPQKHVATLEKAEADTLKEKRKADEEK